MFDVFPSNGLDQSILTPILVGLLLTLLFTETLGWSFVALVIPGYLAAVIITAPWSAVAIVGEAFITYGACHLIGRWLPKHSGSWLSFFGRERFFLLITVSVVVRLLSEGLVVPYVSSLQGYANANVLYSIGLVMVPLTANAFWKVGVVKGSFHTAVLTAATLAIVVLVIMPLTNLDLTVFELTYESVAVDFLSFPKGYLLLLCGAALGAAANIRYGWDFGGILVPALLALAWYSPLKFAATLVEASLVAFIADRVVQSGILGRFVVEGARRVALAFVVGFLIKLIVGHLAGAVAPGYRVTELYGFGYVLPSLIAVKIWQHGSVPRVLVPALAVSISGFVVGNITGYSLMRGMGAPDAEPTLFAGSESAEWEMLLACSWSSNARADLAKPSWESFSFALDEEQPASSWVHSASGERWQISRPAHAPTLAVRDAGEGTLLLLASSASAAFARALQLGELSGVQRVIALPRSAEDSFETWERSLNAGGANVRFVVSSEGQHLRLLDYDGGEEEAAALRGALRQASPNAVIAATVLGASVPLEPQPMALLLAERRDFVFGATAPAVALRPEELRLFDQSVVPAMLDGRLLNAFEGAVARRLGFANRAVEGVLHSVTLESHHPGGLFWMHRPGQGVVSIAPQAGLHRGMFEASVQTFLRLGSADLLIGGQRQAPANASTSPGSGIRTPLQRTFEVLLLQEDRQVIIHRAVPTHRNFHGLDLILTQGVVSRELPSWLEDARRGAWPEIEHWALWNGSRPLYTLRGNNDAMIAFGLRFAGGDVALSWSSERLRSALVNTPPWRPE